MLAVFASSASAGTRTALLQVSMQITESCGVATPDSRARAGAPGSPQVLVNCRFKAPHTLQVTLDPVQGAGASAATGVKTIEF